MLTFQDYEDAKSLLSEYISKRDDIITAWQYGEVSQPGVSDLDLMVLISSNARPGLCDYLKKENLPPLTLKAMAHANVMIMPNETSEGAFYWDNICCTDIKTNKLVETPKIKEKYLRLAMLVDWFFERSFRIYNMQLNGSENFQLMLGMMKSYSYSAENFFWLSGQSQPPEYLTLKKRLNALRNTWLTMKDNDKKEKAKILFSDYFDYARHLHKLVFVWLSHSPKYPNWRGDNSKVRFIYPDGNTFDFVEKFSREINLQNGNPVVQLPNNLLHHFLRYTQHQSDLGKALTNGFSQNVRSFSGKIELPPGSPYTDFLDERMEYAASWLDCLKSQNFNFGLFKFGWYLKKS